MAVQSETPAPNGNRAPNKTTLAVMLLAGVGIGWFLSHALEDGAAGREASAADNTGENRRARRMERPRMESATRGRLAALKADLRKSSREQLPGVVYRILELGDSVERQALLIDAFAGADAATCQAIMDQFGRITRETGRLQHGDWRTGLFLAGKAGGAELLDKWVGVHGAGGTEFQEAIRGFAASDPQGALAWLNAQDEKRLPGKERLLSRLMAGAAMGDPETAIRMMNQLKPEQQDACLDEFTGNLIQGAGLERTTDWLLAAMPAPESADFPQRSAMLEAQLFRRVFEASEWYGCEREMADRIARIHRARPVKPQQLAGMIRKMHGTSALTLAENLASTPVMRDAQTSSMAITTAVRSVSPADVRRWLERHPDSPIRRAVEEAISPPGG